MTAVRTAMIVVASALISAVPAHAEPAEPTPPPAPPPPVAEFIPQQSGIGNALAQSGSQTGLFGLPDLSAAGPTMLLGQNPGPGIPGAPGAPAIPDLNALNPQYLLSQNVSPAAPGDGVTAPGLAPNQDIPGTGRISFLHRIYEMYDAGGLKGSLLGQQSPEEFAQQAAEEFAQQAAETAEAATVLPAESAVPPPPG